MTESMIVGIDRESVQYVTLGEFRQTVGRMEEEELSHWLSHVFAKFLYDPMTGDKVYWDVVESQMREGAE